jgi:hypothetical protein
VSFLLKEKADGLSVFMCGGAIASPEDVSDIKQGILGVTPPQLSERCKGLRSTGLLDSNRSTEGHRIVAMLVVRILDL